MRRLVSGLIPAILFAGCASVNQPVPEPERPVPPVEQPPAEPIIDPKEEAYQAISLAVNLGDPQAAISAYEQSALADPDDPGTSVLLANLYLSAGDIAGALAILDEVLAVAPDNTDALYAKALAMSVTGDTAGQRALLTRVVEIDPAHSDAYAALGELSLRDKSYQAAARSFEASLKADPENFVALIGLGNVRLRTDEPEAAREVLDRVIEIEPEYSFAYADRSRAYILEHNFVKAEEDLAVAIELEPDYFWNRYDRGRVRSERQNYTGAIEDFTFVIDREPELFMTWVYRARAWDSLGEKARAIADYEHARELERGYDGTTIPLAALYFETERYSDAYTLFQSAYESSEEPGHPKDDALALMASLCLKYSGDEAGGRRYIERAAGSFIRPGLAWEVARYFVNPGYSAYVLQLVMDEDERYLRTRMKFYLAAHFQLEGNRNSAQALFLDIEEEGLTGIVETRLARHLYGQL